MPQGVELRPEFVEVNEPQRDENGLLIFSKAREITYDSAASDWDRVNKVVQPLNKNNQVLVIPSLGDCTVPLLQHLQNNQIGKYPVATVINDRYLNEDPQTKLRGVTPNTEHLYIIASVTNANDYDLVQRVAWTSKEVFGITCITLMAPKLGQTRQDKNQGKHGSDPGEVVNIGARMMQLKGLVDRAIVAEPHSSATQAFAAKYDIVLAPLSPSLEITEEVFSKHLKDFSHTRIMGPDKGRNLAARRIAQHYGLKYFSFDKTRISGTDVEMLTLSDNDKADIEGHDAYGYDDVYSTGSTQLQIAKQLGPLVTSFWAGVHLLDLVGNWQHYLKDPLPTGIVGTDAGRSIGNVESVNGRIKIMSLTNWVIRIMRADMAGINFWNDRIYRNMVLQPQNGELADLYNL